MIKVKTLFESIYSKNLDEKINELIEEIAEEEGGVVQDMQSQICGANNSNVLIIIKYTIIDNNFEYNDIDFKFNANHEQYSNAYFEMK